MLGGSLSQYERQFQRCKEEVRYTAVVVSLLSGATVDPEMTKQDMVS